MGKEKKDGIDNRLITDNGHALDCIVALTSSRYSISTGTMPI